MDEFSLTAPVKRMDSRLVLKQGRVRLVGYFVFCNPFSETPDEHD